MVDPDDTTELSDDALRDRLRQLRGEPAIERARPSTVPSLSMLPNLEAYGMIAVETSVTKEATHDAIRYEMDVRLLTAEARKRVLAVVQAGGTMHCPEMFPQLKTDDVYVVHFDADKDEVRFVATLHLEETARVRAPAAMPWPPSGAPPPHPPGTPLLIVGRRERAEQFARTQGLTTGGWRWVRRSTDMLGYGPGTHMRVLDEGHPHSPEELEELLAIARDRQFYVEMVTFGAPSDF
jgi:hypothetical protein